MNDPIQTERLRLVPVTPAHVAAYFRSREELGSLLGASVPDDWPVCPESMEYWREKLAELDNAAGWAGYIFVHEKNAAVIGDGGFKGPPDAGGKVETGYAIVPALRRQGYATEAVKALINWAFSHPEIKYVTAETLPQGKESMRVLEKLGMSYEGTGTDPHEGTVFLWQVSREDFNKPPAPPETDGCPF